MDKYLQRQTVPYTTHLLYSHLAPWTYINEGNTSENMEYVLHQKTNDCVNVFDHWLQPIIWNRFLLTAVFSKLGMLGCIQLVSYLTTAGRVLVKNQRLTFGLYLAPVKHRHYCALLAILCLNYQNSIWTSKRMTYYVERFFWSRFEDDRTFIGTLQQLNNYQRFI